MLSQLLSEVVVVGSIYNEHHKYRYIAEATITKRAIIIE